MNIGIDGNEANVGNRVGVNEYAYEVLWGLYKLQDRNNPKHKFTIFLKSEPKDLPEEKSWWQYKILPGGSFWILKKLSPFLLQNAQKYDLFFTPSHYIPFDLRIPKICSIMDLGYLENSEQFKKRDYWQLRLWTASSIYLSRHIFAISEATKKDIVRHYPASKNKITTTLLGYDSDIYNTKINKNFVRQILDKYTIGSKYFLFLGTLKPNKNIEGILEAWSKIKNKRDCELVIAGKKGWLYESIFQKVKDLHLEDNVVFTDFIPEEDKPALIAGARGFLLPSFWEGFGLDVLSSMACGVPVITTKRGSLPEVAGNAALFVNPDKPAEIAKQIEFLLACNKSEYNKLVKAGLAQVKKFSWEKTAKETLKALESVR